MLIPKLPHLPLVYVRLRFFLFSHSRSREMNERFLFTLISLMCVMMVLACLWHATSHEHIQKLSPLFKVQSFATDRVKKIQFLSKTQPYTIDEEEGGGGSDDEKTPSLLKVLPYTTDEKKMIFSLPKTLPYAANLKKIDEIQQALWTTHLYQFLHSLNKSISPQVNMVFGDSNHMDLVLNWIIAAHVRLDPPLHNIMVLSVDQPLCDFLAKEKLPVTCIAVPPESFLSKYSYSHTYARGIKCRFLVLRIINFWGYDVASYDSDAVPLRNPQPLYDSNPDVKLFAGSGTYPSAISNQWGFSLCACVLLLRSHHSTGTYANMQLNLVNIQAILSSRIQFKQKF